jgi:hypothetical protein
MPADIPNLTSDFYQGKGRWERGDDSFQKQNK